MTRRSYMTEDDLEERFALLNGSRPVDPFVAAVQDEMRRERAFKDRCDDAGVQPYHFTMAERARQYEAGTARVAVIREEMVANLKAL